MKEAIDLKLSKDLKGSPGISFTTDFWSSRNQDPYLGLTLHYINPAWELTRLIFHCGLAEGRHTAQYVAANLDRFDSYIEISHTNPSINNLV